MYNLENNNKIQIDLSNRIINSIFGLKNSYKAISAEKIYFENKEERKNQRIVRLLFNNHEYESLRNLIPLMNLSKEDAKIVDKILRFYNYWDNYEYDMMRKYKFDYFPEILKPIEEKYNENIKALKKIKSKYKEYQLLIDLINNAARRNEEGKNNEAILQLYRAMELITHLRLQKVYGLDTSNIDINRLEELNINSNYVYYLKQLSNKYNVINISLRDHFCLLVELHDPIGKYYRENSDLFNNLIKMRHSSLLVHGTTNITAVQYKEYEYLVKQLACKLNKNIKNYLKETEFPKIL